MARFAPTLRRGGTAVERMAEVTLRNGVKTDRAALAEEPISVSAAAFCAHTEHPARHPRVIRVILRVLIGMMLLGLFGLVGVVGMLVALGVRRWIRAHHSSRQAKAYLPITCAILALLALQLSNTNALSIYGHDVRPGISEPGRQCPCVPLALNGTWEDMADLFNQVNLSYYDRDSSNRIRIITLDTINAPTILVMLPGVLPAHVWDAIKAGMGLPGDPYAAAARHAIEEYIQVGALPHGTRVVLAGHSYGGIVAQELANQPDSAEFKVAAVVTWGAPAIGGRARGVTYEQYFDQYDFVPLLSTHELAPLAIGTGLIGTLGVVSALQAFPDLKAAFTDETYVPDINHYANPVNWIHFDGTWNDAHDSYGQSHWLSQRILAYTRDGTLVVTGVPGLDHPDDQRDIPLKGISATRSDACHGVSS